jgi:adenine deaminase
VAERFGASPEPLAPGALADLVVREDGRVRHVLVGGRVVVQDGALVAADAEAIEAEARREATGLWKRMAAIAASES